MRPGYLHGINNFWFSGYEEEGFYDILTGRPRYPIALHNIVRSDRLKKRGVRLAQILASQPGGGQDLFSYATRLLIPRSGFKKNLRRTKTATTVF